MEATSPANPQSRHIHNLQAGLATTTTPHATHVRSTPPPPRPRRRLRPLRVSFPWMSTLPVSRIHADRSLRPRRNVAARITSVSIAARAATRSRTARRKILPLRRPALREKPRRLLRRSPGAPVIAWDCSPSDRVVSYAVAYTPRRRLVCSSSSSFCSDFPSFFSCSCVSVFCVPLLHLYFSFFS